MADGGSASIFPRVGTDRWIDALFATSIIPHRIYVEHAIRVSYSENRESAIYARLGSGRLMIRIILLFAICVVIYAAWLTIQSRHRYGTIWAGMVAVSTVAAICITEALPHAGFRYLSGTLFKMSLFVGMPTAVIGLVGTIAGVRPLSAKLALATIGIALVFLWIALLLMTLPVS
jgi:hypothetical protein